MRRFLIILVPCLVIAGLIYIYQPWQGKSDEKPLVTDIKTDTPSPDNSNKAHSPVEVPEIPPEQKPNTSEIPDHIPKKDREFMLPDGSMQPVLNGAYGAPNMRWPRGRPYSKIVKIVRDPQGLDWYQHEDGTMSITQNAFRKDLGRMDPVTNVFTTGGTPAQINVMDENPKAPAKKK